MATDPREALDEQLIADHFAHVKRQRARANRSAAAKQAWKRWKDEAAPDPYEPTRAGLCTHTISYATPSGIDCELPCELDADHGEDEHHRNFGHALTWDDTGTIH